ncbi:lipopolysaccharide biosynthesis protein [Nocardioides sp. LS1]|uniref:lipopolysaccharide biosynthesis protein n=1 Tax=Nocardioides sp. LS1 TaxID=1027620 RepID=UPI000FFAAADB|nr:lipopolysaccharide biosynthesis protein [Nocardioides sp. LS1]GCD90659.1 lipopolysaccharide biosynthesis protein [Nocardioides sp. LS1]
MTPPKPRGASSIRRGGLVTVCGQLAKTVIQFLSLITLSRILSPRDFGLVALLTVFVMLGELLRDFGLTQAAMQARSLTRAQASNLFWTNLGVGAVLAGILASAAPLLASTLDEQALAKIAPFIALSLLLNAAQSQFQVQLARSFRFMALTLTDVAAQTAGFASALTAALLGAGYWALVVQILVALSVLLALRAAASGWTPLLPTRGAGMRELYRYGIDVGFAQLVAYGAYNTDSYIIGFRYGATALGVYSRAFTLLMVPFNQLLGPLTNVVLPVLSRERHGSGEFTPTLLRIQYVLGGALIGLFSIVVGLAQPIVELALGSEWAQSAIFLRILSVGGAFQVLSYVAYWAFLVAGQTRHLFWQNVLTKAVLAACVITGASMGHGIVGVASGYAIGLAVSWPISLIWLTRTNSLSGYEFGSSGVYLLGCGALIALACAGTFDILRHHWSLPLLGSTLGASTCGVSTYVLLALASPVTREPIQDIWKSLGVVLGRNGRRITSDTSRRGDRATR